MAVIAHWQVSFTSFPIFTCFLFNFIALSKFQGSTVSYNRAIPVPVASRSKPWVCVHSTAGITGSNPVWGHEWPSVVSVVFCQIQVSASSWSLFQRSLTECGLSECDHEAWIIRNPSPLGRGVVLLWTKNSTVIVKKVESSGRNLIWSTTPELMWGLRKIKINSNNEIQ